MIISHKIHHMIRTYYESLKIGIELDLRDHVPSQINCCLPRVVLQYMNTKLGVLGRVCFTHFSA